MTVCTVLGGEQAVFNRGANIVLHLPDADTQLYREGFITRPDARGLPRCPVLRPREGHKNIHKADHIAGHAHIRRCALQLVQQARRREAFLPLEALGELVDDGVELTVAAQTARSHGRKFPHSALPIGMPFGHDYPLRETRFELV